MSSAHIVVKHNGLTLLDMPVRALLQRMSMNGDLGALGLYPKPDDSTTIETHTAQWTQFERWYQPEDEETMGALEVVSL